MKSRIEDQGCKINNLQQETEDLKKQLRDAKKNINDLTKEKEDQRNTISDQVTSCVTLDILFGNFLLLGPKAYDISTMTSRPFWWGSTCSKRHENQHTGIICYHSPV